MSTIGYNKFVAVNLETIENLKAIRRLGILLSIIGGSAAFVPLILEHLPDLTDSVVGLGIMAYGFLQIHHANRAMENIKNK